MTHFAREYGNALFELATEEGIAQEMEQQLQMLVACFREQPEYIALLDARNIEIEKRKALLDEAFSGRVHAYLLNYLKLLTERGAMRLFTECADFFRIRYNEAYGIAEAQVTSASELDEAQQAALKAKLEEISGKQVVLHLNVDSQLIGGLRVDLEGRRYDNSIRTRLDRMRRSLMETEGREA